MVTVFSDLIVSEASAKNQFISIHNSFTKLIGCDYE